MNNSQPPNPDIDRLVTALRNRRDGIPDPSFDNLTVDQMSAAVTVRLLQDAVSIVMRNLDLP